MLIAVKSSSTVTGGAQHEKYITYTVKRTSDDIATQPGNNKLPTLFKLVKWRKKPSWIAENFFHLVKETTKPNNKKPEERKGVKNQKILDILNNIVKRYAVLGPRQKGVIGETRFKKQGEQNSSEQYRIHNIVKRHAAPDPRPRPRPQPKGGKENEKIETKADHQSLLVRKDLNVDSIGIVFTVIALVLVFVLICVLVICYWKSS